MGRREEEPEWFNSGPISKSDTIELHGFDKLGSRDRKDSEQGRREEKHEDVFEEEESHEEEKDDKDGKCTPFRSMEFSIKLTIMSGWSIVYIEGSPVIIFLKMYFFL